MQLIEVPAKTGYVWFRQGIWLFRKNPLAFLTLFFTYLLVMTLAAQIPVIGGVLPLVFIPGVAVGFMAACRNTIAGKPVFPTILVDGFHSYGPGVAKRLLLLGVLYFVAMALVLAGSALADGGMLLKVMLGMATVDQDVVANSSHMVDYQDCEYSGGSTQICTGVTNLSTAEGGTYELGGIALLDLSTNEVLHELPVQEFSTAGHSVTRNPVAFEAEGDTLRMFAAPDDGEEADGTELLVYAARP